MGVAYRGVPDADRHEVQKQTDDLWVIRQRIGEQTDIRNVEATPTVIGEHGEFTT